jgi:hypothetical protein
MRPGPQPHNKIAGTFEEQMGRAERPRLATRQRKRARLRRRLRRLIGRMLPEIIEVIDYRIKLAQSDRSVRA